LDVAIARWPKTLKTDLDRTVGDVPERLPLLLPVPGASITVVGRMPMRMERRIEKYFPVGFARKQKRFTFAAHTSFIPNINYSKLW